MLDKPKDQALLVGGVVGLLLWALALVPTVLADQPVGWRATLRLGLERGLAAAIGVLAGFVARPWSADVFNAVLGLSPVKVSAQVDVVTATAVIVALTSVLVGDPKARATLFSWVARFIPGGSK